MKIRWIPQHSSRHSLLACTLILAFGPCAGHALLAQEGADPYQKAKTPAPAAPAPGLQAAPKPAAGPPLGYMVSTTIEWVEMASVDALELMRSGLPPNDAGQIQRIREMEVQGKATVVEVVNVVTRSGQRATTEGVKEHIYPTEFDPTPPANLKNLDLSSNQLKDPNLSFVMEAPGKATPTAFEMRPVGARLEVDPIIGPDGKTLELNLAPEMTRFIGEIPYGGVRMGNRMEPLLSEPVFTTAKVTTSVTLLSGQTMIIGVGTPQKEDGTPDPARKWLMLLRAVAFPHEPK